MDNNDAVAGPAEPDEQLGSPVAGADAAGAVGLALAAATGPAVTAGLSDFLVEQQQLARTQREVADRQARLLEHRIERAGLEKEHIAAQNLHLRMRHIHDRLRLVLDAGLAVLGIALLVGIGWTVYGAVTDRSIVVNAFTVAPRLESTGQSGGIVVAQFLDELIRLRESAIEQFRKAEGLALSDADRLTVAHYLSTATR